MTQPKQRQMTRPVDSKKKLINKQKKTKTISYQLAILSSFLTPTLLHRLRTSPQSIHVNKTNMDTHIETHIPDSIGITDTGSSPNPERENKKA